MAASWFVIQHAEWEGPGLLGEAMRARGHDYQLVRSDFGEATPEVEAVAGLIVMGGPMGVYEMEHYPYLARERALMAAMVEKKRPVLGVCLGAQLLASAMGATVAPGSVFEVGAGEVRLSGAGLEDPVLGPAGTYVPVVHWHQDTFPLPDGAVRLASSELYPQQAFRCGRFAYGLQFHCEVDETLAEAWRPHLPKNTALEPDHIARVAEAGRGIISRFLDLSQA